MQQRLPLLTWVFSAAVDAAAEPEPARGKMLKFSEAEGCFATGASSFPLKWKLWFSAQRLLCNAGCPGCWKASWAPVSTIKNWHLRLLCSGYACSTCSATTATMISTHTEPRCWGLRRCWTCVCGTPLAGLAWWRGTAAAGSGTSGTRWTCTQADLALGRWGWSPHWAPATPAVGIIQLMFKSLKKKGGK